MKTSNNEARRPTTPEESKVAKKTRKQHRARIRLVIETFEWVLDRWSRPPRNDEKLAKLIAEMAAHAKDSPEDYGRWANIEARFPDLQKPEL